MSQHTFEAYIDESGDDGLGNFRNIGKSGSSHWLVLAAVIRRIDTDTNPRSIIADINYRFRRPLKAPLHFRNLNHEQKICVIDRISRSNLAICSVLVHKPSITDPKLLLAKNSLYLIALKLLIERLSWYVRDRAIYLDCHDPRCQVLLSRRGNLTDGDVRKFLENLRLRERTSTEWRSIDARQIKVTDPIAEPGLCVADAIASGMAQAVEQSRYGYREPRHARNFFGSLYRYHGNHLGYGAEIFPAEAMEFIAKDHELRWMLTAPPDREIVRKIDISNHPSLRNEPRIFRPGTAVGHSSHLPSTIGSEISQKAATRGTWEEAFE